MTRPFRLSADFSHKGQQLRDYIVGQTEYVAERTALFNAALAGNAGAKQRIRERWPSLRWWREGRWVIGKENGNDQ